MVGLGEVFVRGPLCNHPCGTAVRTLLEQPVVVGAGNLNGAGRGVGNGDGQWSQAVATEQRYNWETATGKLPLGKCDCSLDR